MTRTVVAFESEQTLTAISDLLEKKRHSGALPVPLRTGDDPGSEEYGRGRRGRRL